MTKDINNIKVSIARETNYTENTIESHFTTSHEDSVSQNENKLTNAKNKNENTQNFTLPCPINYPNKLINTQNEKDIQSFTLPCPINYPNELTNTQNEKDIQSFNLPCPISYPNKLTDINKMYNTNLCNSSFIDNSYTFIISPEGYISLLFTDNKTYRLNNFIISPEKIVILDDGVNKNTKYIIKCSLENGKDFKIITIDSNKLYTDKWILDELGIKYFMSTYPKAYEYLKIYISQQFKDIIEEIKYTHVGWRLINNHYVYLHKNGSIGSNNPNIKGSFDKSIQVDPFLNQLEAINQTLGMLNISNNLSKTLPLFLYSHLAVLKYLFLQAGAEPKFLLWIYGLTGSMKTSVSKIFFNLFNRNKECIPASFKDTKASIEIKAFEFKDSVLLLDDYHPTTLSTEKKSMESLASYVLRLYGDSISKSRATKTMGKVKEFPPRGLCVITGEDIIGGESSVARFIGIEVCSNDYNSSILSYYQNNPLIFSTHMYYFISWTSKNFNRIVSYIQSHFESYRNSIDGTFRHKRLNESYSLLMLTRDIFLLYCSESKYNGIIDYYITSDLWKSILIDIIKTHENSTTQQDPAIMYLIAIQDMLLSNKCTLISVGDIKAKNSNMIGFKDDEYYYLIPDLAFNYVIDFWRKQGIEFPVSSERTNKALDELKVIKTSFEGGYTKRTVKFNHNNTGRKRYLTIYIDKMIKALNNI